MKIGLFAINFGTCGNPASAIRVARAAEAAGFESVWTGEHIVLPDPAIPAFPLATETPMLDTTVALTWIAAHTKRLRLASGIILVPLRSPAVLAKELASIDVVSGGALSIRLNPRDIMRHLVCFVTVPQPSFAAVFETPNHALREEEARTQPG
jgi:hypothetical protein